MSRFFECTYSESTECVYYEKINTILQNTKGTLNLSDIDEKFCSSCDKFTPK